MPPRKKSKKTTDKPEDVTRPLYEQLQALNADQLNAIFAAVLAGNSPVDADSASSSSAKRKIGVARDVDSTPCTPSPKKKRAGGPSSVESPVIRALEKLSASTDDVMSTPTGRTMRSRTLSDNPQVAGVTKSTTRILSNIKADDNSVPENSPDNRNSIISLAESDDLLEVDSIVDKDASDDGVDGSGFESLELPDDEADAADLVFSDSAPIACENSDDESLGFAASADEQEGAGDNEDCRVMEDASTSVHGVATKRDDPVNVGAGEHYDIEEFDGATDPTVMVTNPPVMQPDVQDPMFAATYNTLPSLPRVFNIIPYGYDKQISDGSVRFARISAVTSKMSGENAESLVRGLLWVEHGLYVHSARIHPDNLTAKSRRLALNNGGNAFCIDVMFGVVSASHLFDSGVEVGSYSSPYKQKRLMIVPFQQEFLRSMANVGNALGLRSDPMGSYSSYGMAFVTRGEGKSVSFKNSGGYSVPALSKPPVLTDDSMFSVKSAPIVPTPKFKSSVEAVINYESTVPVYDGRSETVPAFWFSAADFNAITSWRSYNGNTSDVPEGSVVAVGYTAGWFEGSSSVFLSTNIKFVMVLHTPDLVVVGGAGTRRMASLMKPGGLEGPASGAPGGSKAISSSGSVGGIPSERCSASAKTSRIAGSTASPRSGVGISASATTRGATSKPTRSAGLPKGKGKNKEVI